MLCGFLFMGWGLHYFPFFLMSRQLFLHHYLPALYFAILLLCAVFDFMTSTLRPRWRLQIAAVLIILAVWNFSIFSPLVYGNTWTRDECEKAKWFKTWDFSCESFFNDYSQYNGAILATPQKSLAGSQPVATIGGEPAGRGAIVVHDDLGQAPNVPPQGEQTSVDAGKAEPGHDVFAQSPQGEVKSDNKVALSPVEDNEPKAISSIGLTSHSDVLSKQDEIASEKPAESASTVSQQDGSPSPSDDASSPASSEAVKAKVQGPLDAEQAEADEVRQELFPDANT
jgi:dolichyl-phosphate-mannose-protein mannosyltransferase